MVWCSNFEHNYFTYLILFSSRRFFGRHCWVSQSNFFKNFCKALPVLFPKVLSFSNFSIGNGSLKAIWSHCLTIFLKLYLSWIELIFTLSSEILYSDKLFFIRSEISSWKFHFLVFLVNRDSLLSSLVPYNDKGFFSKKITTLHGNWQWSFTCRNTAFCKYVLF